MKCPVCNAEASGSGRFCRSCGATLPAGGGAEQGSVCPSCGTAVQPGAKFCAACAAPLSGGSALAAAASSTCANCGAALVAGAKFCKECGRGVASSAPTPDMMPTAAMTTPVQPVSVPRGQPQAPAMAAPVRPAAVSPPAEARSVAPRPSGSNRPILVAGIVVLALVAVGLTYRFVLRKPAVQSAQTAPPVEAPAAAQPTTPASAETTPASAGPESQTAPTGETQPPAEATPAGANPAGNREVAGSAAPAAARAPKRAPAKPGGSGYAEAHNNAVQALAASQFLDPAEGSALFWARKAKALGDPTAAQIEQQAFAGQMAGVQSARQSHNYDQARAMLYVLIHYFPDRPELQPMQGDIQQEEQSYTQQLEQQRRQAEQQAQTKKFAVQHRHGTGSSFCTGVITIAPDGAGRFDCSTADSQGRCDHVAFAPGSLKEVKVRGDGSLHVATRQSGNFDFSGSDSAIRDAATALGPLVKR